MYKFGIRRAGTLRMLWFEIEEVDYEIPNKDLNLERF